MKENNSFTLDLTIHPNKIENFKAAVTPGTVVRRKKSRNYNDVTVLIGH